jgi:hypothetical protein
MVSQTFAQSCLTEYKRLMIRVSLGTRSNLLWMANDVDAVGRNASNMETGRIGRILDQRQDAPVLVAAN